MHLTSHLTLKLLIIFKAGKPGFSVEIDLKMSGLYLGSGCFSILAIPWKLEDSLMLKIKIMWSASFIAFYNFLTGLIVVVHTSCRIEICKFSKEFDFIIKYLAFPLKTGSIFSISSKEIYDMTSPSFARLTLFSSPSHSGTNCAAFPDA